jgi:hypothetical protein
MSSEAFKMSQKLADERPGSSAELYDRLCLRKASSLYVVVITIGNVDREGARLPLYVAHFMWTEIGSVID